PVGPQGPDGSGGVAWAVAGFDVAADRGAAGVAGHSAAAHQPVSQSHQELVAGGRDWISRSGLGICGHDAEPDRAGDRNYRDHDGCLSADFAGDERDHELLWLAAQPEPRQHMSELSDQAFVRRELVPERPAPIKTTGFVGFLRTRLFNSP